MSGKAIFGYGSLILPHSAFARFDDEMKEAIGTPPQRGDGRAQYLLEKELQFTDKVVNSNLRFIPAKISGYKRYYVLERPEGNQLAVFEGDEDDEVNGVIITGLDEEEFEYISETEKGYHLESVGAEKFDLYIDDVELEGDVYFFVAEDKGDFNLDTDKKRNPDYQRFIIEGVKFLAETWFEDEKERKEFIEEFLKDYRENTYEKEKGEWKRLSEIEKDGN